MTAEREVGEVAEITDRVDLSGWPPGARLIVRREQPHPGVQLTFTDVRGHRYQLCLTDLPDPDSAFLAALYRVRGRCDQAIRDLQDTGLAHLPSAAFAMNQAWLTAVLLAGDLLAWLKGLCLPANLLQHAEPKRLRYRLLHAAGDWSGRAAARSCGSPTPDPGPRWWWRPSPAAPNSPAHNIR